MLYGFCKGCPERCDATKAEQLQAARSCDPCDACYNEGSPACATCEAYANFEATDHIDDEVKYPL